MGLSFSGALNIFVFNFARMRPTVVLMYPGVMLPPSLKVELAFKSFLDSGIYV